MGTAMMHPVPDRVKPSSVFWQPGTLTLRSVKNYKWRFNPVRYRMLHRCTNMATVGVKRLTPCRSQSPLINVEIRRNAVYPRQLSVPSLQGRLMSTSQRWGLNGHTTGSFNPQFHLSTRCKKAISEPLGTSSVRLSMKSSDLSKFARWSAVFIAKFSALRKCT